MSQSISWRAFERAGWEAAADPYHSFFGQIGQAVAPRLLEWAGAESGSDVLDLCCGPGYVARAAAELGARAHGLDIAEAMITLARRLVPSGQFAVGDAEQLPYSQPLVRCRRVQLRAAPPSAPRTRRR